MIYCQELFICTKLEREVIIPQVDMLSINGDDLALWLLSLEVGTQLDDSESTTHKNSIWRGKLWLKEIVNSFHCILTIKPQKALLL